MLAGSHEELRAACPGEGLSTSPRCLPSWQDCSLMYLPWVHPWGFLQSPKERVYLCGANTSSPAQFREAGAVCLLQQPDPLADTDLPFSSHDSRAFHFALSFVRLLQCWHDIGICGWGQENALAAPVADSLAAPQGWLSLMIQGQAGQLPAALAAAGRSSSQDRAPPAFAGL